ncbi:allantoinase [Culicoides brevitarsis]|uniref:allantoinase n=1 Tax=Culicoides brevitarsis TaxID=469753 RepID=UPI00307C1DB0
MEVLYSSRRVLLEDNDGTFRLTDAGILVSQETGKILRVLETQEEINSLLMSSRGLNVVDYGNLMILPGLIDSHVHINEPGRTDWEGFETATKAALAGGFTTIVDMPLNSIPPTTTLGNLKTKIEVARQKIYTNCGFWGGVIPGNDKNLQEMIRHGVVGFKCFMCPSGVDEFPHVTLPDLELAMEKLKGYETVLAFHAEVDNSCCGGSNSADPDPKKYETYLKSRPDQMEIEAIQTVCDLSKKHDVNCHIVHLSTALALPTIRQAKLDGIKLTVETCHHYLALNSETVPDASTEFKCAPPIRTKDNQTQLWQALRDKTLDMVVSDHSPSTPGMKLLIYGNKNRGNFLDAWGGISSVQFGLSLFWTNCQMYNFDITDAVRLLCKAPAKLCGFDKTKSRIAVGFDADFCIFDENQTFQVSQEIIQFKNKATPYMGMQLRGVVHATILGGIVAFDKGIVQGGPKGKILLRNGREERMKKRAIPV